MKKEKDITTFDEYLDEIFENSDFSLCIDLYKEKSFDFIPFITVSPVIDFGTADITEVFTN